MRRVMVPAALLIGVAIGSSGPLARGQSGVATPPSTPAKAAAPAAAAAAAAAAPDSTARPAPDSEAAQKAQASRMAGILELWSQRSKTIQSLHAKFLREDVSQVWQDKMQCEGQAFLRSPNLAYLNFQKRDDKGKLTPYERIICTDSKVYHFEAEKKIVHVYTMPEEERKRTLEQGPLPFLFNMDATQAKRRYQMALRGEDAKRYLIEVLPLEQTDRDAFSKALIWLDRTQMMPTHIRLYDPSNAKDTKTFTVTQVQPNPELNEAYFDAAEQVRQVVQAAQWDVVEYGLDGQPLGGASAAAPPSGRSAVKPAGTSAPRR